MHKRVNIIKKKTAILERKHPTTIMNSSENVAAVITDIFQSKKSNHFIDDLSVWFENKEVSHKLYETLFNWINDPIVTPWDIIHTLELKLKGLDEFFGFRNVIAFFCIRALSKRRPVLEGPWERVAYSIMNYSRKCDQTVGSLGGHNVVDSKKAGVIWLHRIKKLCLPIYCPNPCLRLQIINLKLHFTPLFQDFDYDEDSFQKLTINTICDILDANSYITENIIQISACDFNNIIIDNSIDILSIMGKFTSRFKQTKVIGAIMKITLMFALKEKKKSVENMNMTTLNVCSNFCGLLPRDDNFKLHISCFIKFVKQEPFLLDYVIETYRIVHDCSDRLGYSFSILRVNLRRHTEIRDMILFMFFQEYTNSIPMHSYLREIQGGITPAAEYRVRYFSNNLESSGEEMYNNYENNVSDSEENVSDEVDSSEAISEDDSEENLEENVSDEFDSSEAISEDDSEENFAMDVPDIFL